MRRHVSDDLKSRCVGLHVCVHPKGNFAFNDRVLNIEFPHRRNYSGADLSTAVQHAKSFKDTYTDTSRVRSSLRGAPPPALTSSEQPKRTEAPHPYVWLCSLGVTSEKV